MIVTGVILFCTTAVLQPIAAVPQHERDIVDTAVAAGSFQTLVTALKAANLVDTLKGDGPYTVFAPTDEAFAKLPEGTIPELLRPSNRAKLVAILSRHVVKGRVTAMSALGAGSVTTLGGGTVRIALEGGQVRVGEANLVKEDIATRNGVIHVIDSVLLPPATDSRRPVRDTLVLAIDRGVPEYNAGRAGSCVSIYEVAVRSVLAMAGSELTAEERSVLEKALASLPHERGNRERAWTLRRAMDRVLTGEAKPVKVKPEFKPLIEASLPEGFPAPGPVGEVVLKDYPKYRAARAEGANSFWTLFGHIKKNNIAMTAPVEMGITENKGDLKRESMAFLYASPALGRVGRDGRVEVVDLERRIVLSYGIRGPLTDEKTREAKRAIEERLNGENWKRDGEWRLLGYNSPMVPAERRFWELQLPVARIDTQ